MAFERANLVRFVVNCGRVGNFKAEDIRYLNACERGGTEGMVSKRLREYIAGRLLARQAFDVLGYGNKALPVGKNREPLWPAACVGSITHTDEICVVVVADRAEMLAIGIDMEPMRSIEPGLWRVICDTQELRKFPANRPLGLSVLWAFSAKEAFYKAQFPLTGVDLDFLDVDVELDLERGRFSVRVKTPEHAACDIAEKGIGRLWSSGSHLGATWLVKQGDCIG